MRKRMMLLAGACCLLFACQSNEELQKVSQESNVPMFLEASIASGVLTSRTTTSEQGVSNFELTDRIGLFQPNGDEASCWEYGEDGWTTETEMNWENKVEDFHFCAFYPYQGTATRSSVPMPDLTVQTGELERIGTFDFLVGHRTTSYADAAGVVSFTEDNAFRHVYAMLKIVVNKSSVEDELTIHQVSFEGQDIVTAQTYSFGSSFAEDRLVSGSPSTSVLTLTPEVTVAEESHTFVVLINPVTLSSSLKLSLDYTRNSIRYSASTEGLVSEYTGGKLYTYTIRLKKENILIEGNSIGNWESQVGDDIWVDENHTSEEMD